MRGKRLILIVIIAGVLILGDGCVPSMTVNLYDKEKVTKNLNVDKFRNGDPILHASTTEEWLRAAETRTPAWCYLDNDPENGKAYGKLYNWWAVQDSRGLCPKGWYIPGRVAWMRLTHCDYYGDSSGLKLKSTMGWKDDGNGTNESGFSGLPSGIRFSNGEFSKEGKYGEWWTSTRFTSGTFEGKSAAVSLSYKDSYCRWYPVRVDSISPGLSVRCFKKK